MFPSQSPFPCRWWGTGLEKAGLGDVRPDVGTYGRYEFERLPPLPFDMRGDFAWLAARPEYEQGIGEEMAEANAAALPNLRESSARLGLRLPEAFRKFTETPALHQRIRSNTDCYLDLCPEPVQSPIGDGYLVRFLADSQGCLFWYLYLTPDGSDQAVVSSPGFYGADEEQWQEELPDQSEIVYCAESFEAFLCRFWLENEIWFAQYLKTPMPDVGQEYIDRYRGKGT
jgi:hypothetical protein